MGKLSDLSKKQLRDLYVNKKMSLNDIGRLYKVTRQAVYRRLKKYNIKQRTKSQARLEAQKQDKLPQKYFHKKESEYGKRVEAMA